MTKDSSCQNQLWLSQWTLLLYLPSVQHDARRTGFNFKSDSIILLYMGFPGISPNYDMTAINHYFRHLLWILTHPQMLPHPLHISKPELSSPRACLKIHPDVIEHHSLSPPVCQQEDRIPQNQELSIQNLLHFILSCAFHLFRVDG